MAADRDPRDDFEVFAEYEHMFFGLSEPYAMIREETARILEQQVPGTRIESIQCHGEPKWLTLGREVPDSSAKLVVGHFAFCFRCDISVETPSDSEVIDATLTFMFGNMDRPGEQKMRVDMAVYADAEAAIAPEEFQRRFVEFRGQFE